MKRLIPIFVLFACDNPYAEAEKAGDIAAYEAFLEKNPDHHKAFDAKIVLKSLYYDKAKSSAALADYDAYLDKYDESEDPKMYKEMVAGRQKIAWAAVKDGKDVKGLKAYIERYSKKGHKTVNAAQRILTIAEYDGLSMTSHKQERASMSRNEKGALDGWKFSASFTNTGDKEIKELDMRIDYLDDKGRVIDSETVVAVGLGIYKHNWPERFNDPEELEKHPKLRRMKPPLKRKETRDFEHITGTLPEGWSQDVKLSFERIVFES